MSLLVETTFFLHFSETAAIFFRLVEIIFHGNAYFQLVETEFRANNGFHKQKKNC